jgi:hypothetical protein
MYFIHRQTITENRIQSSKSTSSERFIFVVIVENTSLFWRRSGIGNSILRSSLPGLSKAGSKVSWRLVAMITCKEYKGGDYNEAHDIMYQWILSWPPVGPLLWPHSRPFSYHVLPGCAIPVTFTKMMVSHPLENSKRNPSIQHLMIVQGTSGWQQEHLPTPGLHPRENDESPMFTIQRLLSIGRI